MTYMGSKRLYAKYICPIINKYIEDNKVTKFYDVFCGGANIADKIICDEVIANDLSPTLIALHKQAQSDFSKIPISKSFNKEKWVSTYAEYKRLKNSNWTEEPLIPLYEIGAVEWYGSYATGGFQKSYALPTKKRDFYDERYRNHKKQSSTDNYKKIKFTCQDYRDLEITPNAVIYCDPPYKGTVSYQICPHFNSEEFFNWIREKSKTNPIFLSESTLIEDFNIIWKKETRRYTSIKNEYKTQEILYFIDNRN